MPAADPDTHLKPALDTEILPAISALLTGHCLDPRAATRTARVSDKVTIEMNVQLEQLRGIRSYSRPSETQYFYVNRPMSTRHFYKFPGVSRWCHMYRKSRIPPFALH